LVHNLLFTGETNVGVVGATFGESTRASSLPHEIIKALAIIYKKLFHLYFFIIFKYDGVSKYTFAIYIPSVWPSRLTFTVPFSKGYDLLEINIEVRI
jgi:hypothetical protein